MVTGRRRCICTVLGAILITILSGWYVQAGAYTVLHNFTGTSTDGSSPWGGFVASGNILYGTTSSGGTSNYGTIFSYNTSTSTFTVLYSFTNGLDGAYPKCSLIIDSGGTLYGVASTGGVNNKGTVFSYNPATSTFNTLHAFGGGSRRGLPEHRTLALWNHDPLRDYHRLWRHQRLWHGIHNRHERLELPGFVQLRGRL